MIVLVENGRTLGFPRRREASSGDYHGANYQQRAIVHDKGQLKVVSLPPHHTVGLDTYLNHAKVLATTYLKADGTEDFLSSSKSPSQIKLYARMLNL